MGEPRLAEDEPDDGIGTLIGRRSHSRLFVNAPADFALGGVTLPVTVLDISASGAQLRSASPPPPGASGCLMWDGIQCKCNVMWQHDDVFGVHFLC